MSRGGYVTNTKDSSRLNPCRIPFIKALVCYSASFSYVPSHFRCGALLHQHSSSNTCVARLARIIKLATMLILTPVLLDGVNDLCGVMQFNLELNDQITQFLRHNNFNSCSCSWTFCVRCSLTLEPPRGVIFSPRCNSDAVILQMFTLINEITLNYTIMTTVGVGFSLRWMVLRVWRGQHSKGLSLPPVLVVLSLSSLLRLNWWLQQGDISQCLPVDGGSNESESSQTASWLGSFCPMSVHQD